MKLNLIYHTPKYPKLVEAVARLCYQSYDKVSPTSHTMPRGIMKLGHLSVAGVGNIVFTVKLNGGNTNEALYTMTDLATLKEINNFIRWSLKDPINNKTEHSIVISMNALTLMDINNNKDKYKLQSGLLEKMLEEVSKIPDINFFIDQESNIEPCINPYIAEPVLGKPTILINDYEVLRALGLNDYELSVHTTITADFVTDRASGLQAWRHSDMAGGTELSQRYVRRDNAECRLPILGEEGVSEEATEKHKEALEMFYEESFKVYGLLISQLMLDGYKEKRAKEIARSVLTNATKTRTIQCRPLRQWNHFFDLRLTPHAQPEIREDAKHLFVAMREAGVKLEVR